MAVDNMINRVRPFFEKKGETQRKDHGLLQRRIYLMNMPYDATPKEIEGLVKEFAEVEEVVIPRDR